MAKRINYGFEKRQKEIKRLKKKEEKTLKRQGKHPSDSSPDSTARPTEGSGSPAESQETVSETKQEPKQG